jgi:WhiB family redox-sensing transcriptional regulator
VRAECLRHAIQVQEPYGIWGGMGENERRAVISSTRRRVKSRAS